MLKKTKFKKDTMIASVPQFFYSKNKYFNVGSGVYKATDKIKVLYRVQDIGSLNSLHGMILGIYSSIHFQTMQANNVVEHQKSTRLVGTTASLESAFNLNRSWKRDLILEIDPKYMLDSIIDVDLTVKNKTSFYPKVNEREFCMRLLPICAIKKMHYVIDNENKNINSFDNPFYIDPNKEGYKEDFEKIYKTHLNYLQTLFEEGEELKKSSSARQIKISELVEEYDQFYKKHLGSANFLSMTLSEFELLYGNKVFKKLTNNSSLVDDEKTIKSLMLEMGDEILMESRHYSNLLTSKLAHELQEESRMHYERNSYSFD